MHVNDLKHAALLTLLGLTEGHVSDLEGAWLETQGAESFNDLAYKAGFAGPSEWLSSLGYTGHINDQWYQYWLAGGGGGTPPVDNPIEDRFGIFITDRNSENILAR